MTRDELLGWEIIAALEKAGICFECREYVHKVKEKESKSAAWWWRNKFTWDTADFRYAAPISRPRPSGEKAHRLRRIHAAIERVRYYAPECLKTLRLILVNRSNRELSIDTLAAIRSTHPKAWEAARKKYYRNLKKLLRLFNVQGD